MKKKFKNEIEIISSETGEIKKFNGAMSIHKFMRDNKGWLIHN